MILAGTSEGIHLVEGDAVLHAGSVRAMTAGDDMVAVLDDNHIVRSGDGRAWTADTRIDGPSVRCIASVGGRLLAGTAEARLYAAAGDESGPIASFDRVEGRDRWHTPWGGPPDTRSISATDGEIYANVHVGGIPRSDDGGETWEPTIDIESDVHQVLSGAGLVLAPCAWGLAVSEDRGASWRVDRDGLHGSYCRAVAIAGDTVLVTASTGPFTNRAAVYRRPLRSTGAFERCAGGLPEWFGSNIDTHALAASGATASFGTDDGEVWRSSDEGRTWERAATGLPCDQLHPRDGPAMSTEPPVVRTTDLTKFYGRHRGVEDVSLEVLRGEIFGFLGPNGAGKTTTIRTLMDLIRPTRGRAELFGLDARRNGTEARAHVGYLPGELHLYEHMTGRDHLRYLANLRGGFDRTLVEELAARLDADLSRRIAELSKGNKQKIGLIQALIARPRLLILDEPTGGLDPLVQHEVHRLVADTRERGGTVFLSSHDLGEVEALCDRVGIIREGRLITVEHIAALKSRALRRIEIHFRDPVDAAEFEALPGVRGVTVRDGIVTCTVVGEVDAVVKAAARHPVVKVISREPSLEEIFLTYYEDQRAP